MPPHEDLEPDDDAEEIPAPDARRVAARCGALMALAYRSFLEQGATEGDREALRVELLRWTDDAAHAVGRELEPAERTQLETPIARLSPKDVAKSSWLVEPAAVLAWALGLIELPTYDAAVEGERVSRAIRFLQAPWPLPDEATLRERGELEDAWSSALALHWRLRQWTRDRAPIDFARFVATCAWAPLNTKGLALWDGDLLLRGRRLTKSEDDFQECYSIAGERHRAFEWLLGDNAVLWSDVTTDT